MKLKENLLYINEHLNCKNYNHDDSRSMATTVELKKGEKYERSLDVPEIVFIYRGKLLVSFRDNYDVMISKRKIVLLPAGVHVQFITVEDSCLFILRMHTEVSYCTLLDFDKLADYTEPNGPYFNPLTANNSILRYLKGFLPHLGNGLRCRFYLKHKITELFFLLRAYYAKEDLAAFFYPLLGGDFSFRNFVFNTVGEIASVEKWAESANLSVPAFRRKFKSMMGKSPSSFLIEEKSTIIRRELENGTKPLKIIAEMLGFSSVSVFHVFCRKHLKETPAVIRKKAQGRPICADPK